MSVPGKCEAVVWKRDVLRYTGGKQKFQMHYNRKQCSRNAAKDGLCWQHLQRPNVLRCGYVHREPVETKEFK